MHDAIGKIIVAYQVNQENEMSEVDPVVESKEWRAWEDHQPPDPVSFHTTGTVVFRETNWAAKLERATPQGINPKSLLLVLTVSELGTVHGDAITPVDVDYAEEDSGADRYTDVLIVRAGAGLGGTHITEIEIVS